MPRRRINVAKLYQLKDQLSALDAAREKVWIAKQIMFDTFHRQHWQAAVDRAWFKLRAPGVKHVGWFSWTLNGREHKRVVPIVDRGVNMFV